MFLQVHADKSCNIPYYYITAVYTTLGQHSDYTRTKAHLRDHVPPWHLGTAGIWEYRARVAVTCPRGVHMGVIVRGALYHKLPAHVNHRHAIKRLRYH